MLDIVANITIKSRGWTLKNVENDSFSHSVKTAQVNIEHASPGSTTALMTDSINSKVNSI